MAGGVFSSAKLNGMTIRESANDGSDFTNPDADYRRLFLGEDGLLYVKDSAGTVTHPYEGGSGNVATDAIFDAKGDLPVGTGANTAAKLTVGANGSILAALSTEATGLIWRAGPVGAAYKRTSGNYTTSGTTFADVDGTNMSLTITTLARRVRVGFVGSVSNSGTSNTALTVDLDGTNLGAAISSGFGGLVNYRTPTAGYTGDMSFVFLTDVLTAASHTFKLQWAVASGTSTMYGAAGGGIQGYCQFWVEETLLTA